MPYGTVQAGRHSQTPVYAKSLADCRHEADKSQLDPLLRLYDTVILEKIEQPLVAKALDIVGGHVIDRLRAVAKPHQTTVDKLAHGPLEAGFYGVILP